MFEGSLAKYWLGLSDNRKEATDVQVSFLKGILKEGLVLDLCCGPGRVSVPLSTSIPVVGLDLSIYLLQIANKRAKHADFQDLYFVRADMSHFPFRPGVFDYVINIFTSFGYFPEGENKIVLKEVAEALKSEGTFILDMANPGWLIRNFREKDWDEERNYISLQQRSVNWKSKRWKSKWIVINKQTGEIDEISFHHRLYDVQELTELLDNEGLLTAQIFGSFRKDDFNEARSRRIIILSRKRAHVPTQQKLQMQ